MRPIPRGALTTSSSSSTRYGERREPEGPRVGVLADVLLAVDDADARILERVEIRGRPVDRRVVPDHDLARRGRRPEEHVLDALRQEVDAVVRQDDDRDPVAVGVGARAELGARELMPLPRPSIVGNALATRAMVVRPGFGCAAPLATRLAQLPPLRSWSARRARGYVVARCPSVAERRPCVEARMSDSIGAQIRSGLAWKAGSQITLQLSRMLVALVLARLLAPHDWGLAAMVLVVSGFVVVFTDSALVSALIQRRDLRDEDCSTVFWLSAAIGLLLMLGGLRAGGPTRRASTASRRSRPLFAALSVGFLVSALRTTPSALLLREMEFRALELVQIAATLVGAAVGIASRSPTAARGRSSASSSRRSWSSTVLLWFALALAPLGDVLVRERPPPRRRSRATSSARTSSTRPAGTSAAS